MPGILTPNPEDEEDELDWGGTDAEEGKPSRDRMCSVRWSFASVATTPIPHNKPEHGRAPAKGGVSGGHRLESGPGRADRRPTAEQLGGGSGGCWGTSVRLEARASPPVWPETWAGPLRCEHRAPGLRQAQGQGVCLAQGQKAVLREHCGLCGAAEGGRGDEVWHAGLTPSPGPPPTHLCSTQTPISLPVYEESHYPAIDNKTRLATLARISLENISSAGWWLCWDTAAFVTRAAKTGQ